MSHKEFDTKGTADAANLGWRVNEVVPTPTNQAHFSTTQSTHE